MSQLKITPANTSVIICCAGMGTRLGIGTTKALVDVCGEPLIIRQLQLLDDYDDVRIVAGYKAEKLINIVNEYRKDIMFVFNYNFETTGVADSLRKGLLGAREFFLSLDGDLLVNPDDFAAFARCGEECLPVCDISSAEPVLATVEDGMVTNLSWETGTCQWPGIVKMRSDKFTGDAHNVFEVVSSNFPMKAFPVRAKEIDTPEDYDAAIEWFENGCKE